MALYNPNVKIEILNAIMAENTFDEPLTENNVVLKDFVHGASSSTCYVDGVRYSGLKSFRKVTYHRISISELFKNMKLVVEAPECKTTKDLLPIIGATYGLFLTEADIVDHPISWFDPEQDFIYECILEIKANHPLYYGTVTVSVSGILLDIEKIIVVTEVDGIIDTSPHSGVKQNITMCTYGYDYSANSEWLKATFPPRKTPGGYDTITDANLKELARRLSAMDGLPWTFGPNNKEFNLKGAMVAAHCLVSEYSKNYPRPTAQPNEEYQYILVLATGATDVNNTTYNGWTYFIHYDVIGRID